MLSKSTNDLAKNVNNSQKKEQIRDSILRTLTSQSVSYTHKYKHIIHTTYNNNSKIRTFSQTFANLFHARLSYTHYTETLLPTSAFNEYFAV